MQIKTTFLQLEEKEHLKQMLFDYFNEIDASKIIETTNKRTLDYPYLNSYWTDKGRFPLKIEFDNKMVGFALINNWVINKEFNADHSIAEFYIKPTYRKKGIGKEVAYHLFHKFAGKWEIRQSSKNHIAVLFWRNIISEYTNGNYKETEHKTNDVIELIQLFES